MGRAQGPSLALASALVLAAAPGVLAAELAAGPADAVTGEALFTGARRMQNGGAACGACHAVGGHGAALAASLGPDLSRSFDGLPADAVDGMLQDLPFPTMAPIYTGHPLTTQERADLAAFLIASTGAAPGGGRVAGYAGATALALLLVLAGAARRRKGPTRSRLRAHPPSPERPPLVGGSDARPTSVGATRASASGGGTR